MVSVTESIIISSRPSIISQAKRIAEKASEQEPTAIIVPNSDREVHVAPGRFMGKSQSVSVLQLHHLHKTVQAHNAKGLTSDGVHRKCRWNNDDDAFRKKAQLDGI